jgi:WD40 repeat protein
VFSKLWDVETSRRIYSKQLETLAQGYCQVLFNPVDENVILYATPGGAELFDLTSRRPITVLSGVSPWVSESDTPPHRLSISPDGATLAVSHYNNIQIWDIEAKELLATLEGHRLSVRQIRFLPDCQRIVTSSWDSTVRIWDISKVRISTEHKAEPLAITSSWLLAEDDVSNYTDLLAIFDTYKLF